MAVKLTISAKGFANPLVFDLPAPTIPLPVGVDARFLASSPPNTEIEEIEVTLTMGPFTIVRDRAIGKIPFDVFGFLGTTVGGIVKDEDASIMLEVSQSGVFPDQAASGIAGVASGITGAVESAVKAVEGVL